MTLSLPDYYDPAQVADVYIERADLVSEAATAYQQQHHIGPADDDTYRIAAFGIDCQIGFCTPGASLFVPGAVEDMQRALGWLYSHLDKLTALYFSMDTHHVFQVFHPAWWVGRHGEHPEPFTSITADDVRHGVWTPRQHRELALEYCEKLEQTGKYTLTVWPYHTLLGGVSHALVPALMEVSILHSVARNTQTHLETKGAYDLTENYSVLSPEVTELGGRRIAGFNERLMQALLAYDRVYVFGEAKSHCVRATLYDMSEYIQANDPDLADRVWILEDAMSPVPPPLLEPLPPELDFPRLAEAAMDDFRGAGFHVVRSTDPIEI
jgi:nicotinamidase-related amidase